MKHLIFIALFSLSTLLHAQGFSLKGKVTGDRGEPIYNAYLQLQGLRYQTTSDYEGNYAFAGIPKGSYKVLIYCVGYEKDTVSVELNSNAQTDIRLTPTNLKLDEIVIKGDKITEIETASKFQLKGPTLIKHQSMIEDPIGALALMPGVARRTDLFNPSQLYVRGGAPSENLFMLDNVPVAWPWVFGGQKSVFNPEVVEDIEFITGGFPASYGNSLSSVFNAKVKDGNKEKWKGNTSLGLYNSQATAEGPIIKDRLSVIVSGRTSYLDLILKNASFPLINLRDVTSKVTYQMSDKHKLSFTNMLSWESVEFEGNSDMDFLDTEGTKNLQSLQWQGHFGKKLYSKLSLTHNQTFDEFDIGENSSQIEAEQWAMREDLSYFFTNSSKIKAGFEYSYSPLSVKATTVPNINSYNPDFSSPPENTTNTYRIRERWGTYLLYEYQKGRFNTNVGVRYDQKGSQSSLSPRVHLSYAILPKTSIKGSYGIYNQFQDGTSKPSEAIHYVLGIHRRFSKTFNASIEAYYKDYSNLATVNYLDNTSTSNGKGFAQGIEFFAMKKAGKFSFLVSYALSESKRTEGFDNKLYRFEFDQTHIANISAHYDLLKVNTPYPSKYELGFRYETGRPYTPVEQAVLRGDAWYPVIGEINSQRLDDYHSLDFKMSWALEFGKWSMESYAQIWNLYDRANPLSASYTYGEEYDNNVQTSFLRSQSFLFSGGFKLYF